MNGWRVYVRRFLSALEKPFRSVARLEWAKYLSRRRGVAASGSTGPTSTTSVVHPVAANGKPGNHRRRIDRTAVAELLGIWGALVATPMALVGVVDMSTPLKVIWICVFAVDAAAGTALVGLLLSHGAAARRRRYKLALFGFALIIPASVVVGVVAGNTWESAVRANFGQPCAVVGTGNEEYRQAFYDAYERHGGAAALGCPLGPVQLLEGSFHQNFDGPHGRSVIMASAADRAYVLTGRPYAAYLAIGSGDGVQSSVLAGFPSTDEVRLRRGAKVELGAGGRWERSGLVGKDGSSWFWVPPEMWSRYDGDLGGPDGRLGYPTGPVQSWNDGSRQQFEHGWLWYRPDQGAVTSWEYDQGGAAPRPSGSANPPTRSLVYQVDAGGAISHEMPEAASIRQDFRPSLPFIDQIGVIAGVDPRNRTTPFHSLTLELLDGNQHQLITRTVPLRDNVLTYVTFPAVRVDPGGTYYLRVTNSSRDIVGIYLNNPAGQGQVAKSSARAYLIGELPNPAPHHDPIGVLCGRVDGTTG